MIQEPFPRSLSIASLLGEKPLFVFALDSEASHEFEEYNPLILGIGKVNAAYELTKRILQDRPSVIVNLGSAGSNTFRKGQVVCCTRFVQRDMDVTGLGYRKYETPFTGLEPVLTYGLRAEGLPEGTCGTGDNFETGHVAPDYEVVDMEAFPLAYIALKEQIPFLCLKYISDGADSAAAEDWLEEVHRAAAALKKSINDLLR